MQQKTNPAAVSPAGGARDSLVSQRANVPSAPQKSKQVYYLHVRPDGGEERHGVEPKHTPTLTVEVIEDHGCKVLERTWTRRVPTSMYSGLWKNVEPRGVGWKLENDLLDSACWLRVREVRS